MEDKLVLKHDPPYKFVMAYEFADRRFDARKREVLQRVHQDLQFFTINDVKLVQFACVELDFVIDVGLYRHMEWSVLKGNIKVAMKTRNPKFELIEDLCISNNMYDLAPGIDDSKHDLFTVIPDNSIIFLSQIKIDGMWMFLK